MNNPAKSILNPPQEVMRTVFLYVGQGDSTLLIIPDGGSGHHYVLVDINTSIELSGLDVVGMLVDLLPKDDENIPHLDLFINTHPHSDHIRGLEELSNRIHVQNVWHTGFEPGKDHEDFHTHLLNLIEKVMKSGGEVHEYDGTRETYEIGASSVNIVSPAEYLKEEINELDDDERDRKIHEYCGVFRVGYGKDTKYVLLTGDSDKAAWQNHITSYHKDRLPANVLSASHHGSRSFFKTGEDDEEQFTEHLDTIGPTWIIISSPEQKKSPHGHPHDDAVEIYKQYVESDDLIVLGEKKICVLYDIYKDGDDKITDDGGDLVKYYPLSKSEENGGNGKAGTAAVIPGTRDVSGRTMGSRKK